MNALTLQLFTFYFLLISLVKLSNLLNDVVLHGCGQLGIDGQGDGAVCGLFRRREISLRVAQILEALLLVEGDRVVDLAADVVVVEMLAQGVAISGHAHDVLVVDMKFTIIGDMRLDHALDVEMGVVIGGVLLTAFVPGIEMGQLDAENGSLHGIQAEVAADHLMVVLGMGAVVAQLGDLLGKGVVIGGDHATVAHAAQILGGEEAETAGQAHGPGALLTVFGRVAAANSLGRVFDHGDLVGVGDLQDAVHVGALAVEMHRDDGFHSIDFIGIGRKPGLQLGRVEVVSLGIYAHEHRGGREAHDDAGRGKEGVRRGDDQIAVAHAHTHE